MDKNKLKSLYSPFRGSLLHSFCAVMAALVLTLGMIILIHTFCHLPASSENISSSYSDDTALRAEMEKISSDTASEVAE